MLFMVLQVNYLRAQYLFEAPDTVCPKQLVQLKSNFPTASSHYWGFCSGYMLNNPVGSNVKDTEFYENPYGIEIAEDKGKYYGFVILRNSREFLRLEFGNSLDNKPTITNYGDMDAVLPIFPTSLYVVKTEDSSWHVFVAGGNGTANSTLARIDFGKDLATTPNIVNFGGLGNLMVNPTGLFVTKEIDNKWYGLVINNMDDANIIRIEFDTNISFTPKLVDLGAVLDATGVPAFTEPNDMAPVKVNGLWHLFVTNKAGNFVFRVDIGNNLATGVPVATPIGNLLGKLSAPSGISIIRDCDSMYALITNRGSGGVSGLVRMNMPTAFGPYNATSYGNVGNMVSPTSLSSVLRDRDNVYCFAANVDSSISRIKFAQCDRTNITYSTTNVPPAYFYDTAGTYNIYYAINEGKPEMQIQCKLITVLPTPPLFMTPQDTTICQGDSVFLSAFSVNALSYTWSPDKFISSTNSGQALAWPEYSTRYYLRMPFPHNCVIDTVVKVNVVKTKADAGPDRVIADGASTILGGPFTSADAENPSYFSYRWSPEQYIDDIHSANPVVRPPNDFTYTLHVINRTVAQPICESIDTVVIHVNCADINLPNAFAPNAGNNTRARFGLANQQIVKLNYFHIYDRWGKLVFDAGEDMTKEWDGTVDGKDAPAGVYVWQASGFCASNQRVIKSGNVTLIR